jgi:poly-gamma-glutamate synthesis protein (capsule biosynthesis protein)
MKLLLCGDVMLGRGIDQILPASCDPVLYERWVPSALDYYALAVRASGPIPRGVSPEYVWGDARAAADEAAPDLRILNLETAVTACPAAAPKGINYRMHPDNLPALSAFAPSCCVLANNHVLDWGLDGLRETLGALRVENLTFAGAGVDACEAGAPAVLPLGQDRRVLVWAVACPSSGTPPDWAAGEGRPGVNVLPEASARTARALAAAIAADRRPGDFVVLSIHWGPNWGYQITPDHQAFAHALIDSGAVDLVHGHSSHHPKAAEVRRGRLILYGCGDFLNDYEGIGGYEAYRGDLALMYLVEVDADGALVEVEARPFRIRRFRLETAAADDAAWLAGLLDRECGRFGGGATLTETGGIRLSAHPDRDARTAPFPITKP